MGTLAVKLALAALLLSSIALPAFADTVFRSPLNAPIFFAAETPPAVVPMAFSTSPSSFSVAGGATNASPFVLDAAGAASVDYEILPTAGSLEPPAWMHASSGSIQANPERSITPGPYGPYILRATASGKPAVDSQPFTITAVRPPLSFSASPSDLPVVTGGSAYATYSVSNADLGSPLYSVVLEASGAAAPAWISAANGRVTATPDAGVASQPHGPYVVEVADEGRATVRSSPFTVTVSTPVWKEAKPSSWSVGSTSAVTTYHYTNGSAAQYAAWTDGVDAPVSTVTGQVLFHTSNFNYSTPTKIDSCVFRIGSATAANLPSNVQFRFWGYANEANGGPRDIYVDPIVTGHTATYSGPCALGSSRTRVQFIPLNLNGVSFHVYEAWLGTGGTPPR